MLEGLFGGRNAARVLLFLENYGDGYATEIARTYGSALRPIQAQLDRFERAGFLVSRLRGRTRLFTWNPRGPFVPKLRDLLATGLEQVPEDDRNRYYLQRRRPRARGKPL
jgi:hypothetical protein